MHAGQRVGGYRLVRELGEGGTSVVWLAEHRELACTRALKFPHPGHRMPRDRIVREARFQATVQHPNVVSVHDVFDHAGEAVIVQDFVEGMELTDLLTFPMAPHRLEGVLRDVLSGLAALHAAGIVHRDLKPSNVIVTPGGRACILDLGIARSDHHASTTAAGVLLGTPAYMSPEQATDPRQVDLRSDLFSVGCIALTLLVGHNPFARGTIGETLAAIHHCDAIREEALAGLDTAGAHGRILQFIRQTVVHDRDARLRTATQGMGLLHHPAYETLQTLVPATEEDERTVPERQRELTIAGAVGAIGGFVVAACTLLLAIVGWGATAFLLAEGPALAQHHDPGTPEAWRSMEQIPVLTGSAELRLPDRTEIQRLVVERDQRRGLRGLFRRGAD
jgi:predicted Ser/Thr protein kinase